MSKYQKANSIFKQISVLLILLIGAAHFTNGQNKDNKQQAQIQTPTLKRTTTKQETRSFSYGSSITILGAPNGSVTVEGWNKNEVEVMAEIELQANSEEDLAKLAMVNSFIIDEDFNSLKILTVGTHDKSYMKRTAKNFPKQLLALPWKIDYKIKVPALCDVDINVGKGAINLKGVEGAILITAAESDASLTLTGGYVRVTVGRGNVDVNLLSRSWRGAGAVVQLGTGELKLNLPLSFNAYISAEVLRVGKLENAYPTLKPERLTKATDKSIQGIAGTGGTTLKFTVGDGMLKIGQKEQ